MTKKDKSSEINVPDKIARYSIQFAHLAQCHVEHQYSSSEGKFEYGIVCKLTIFQHEGFRTGFVQYQVGKFNDKSEALFKIDCRYGFGLDYEGEPSDEEGDAALVHVAKTALWIKFQSIFHQMVGQAETRMPPLPNAPDEVEVVPATDIFSNPVFAAAAAKG